MSRFRPFATAIRLDAAADYIDPAQVSPFRNVVFDFRCPSRMPAVTHVDGTSRVQTVTAASAEPAFVELLNALEERTDVPTVLNNSFNVNGSTENRSAE